MKPLPQARPTDATPPAGHSARRMRIAMGTWVAIEAHAAHEAAVRMAPANGEHVGSVPAPGHAGPAPVPSASHAPAGAAVSQHAIGSAPVGNFVHPTAPPMNALHPPAPAIHAAPALHAAPVAHASQPRPTCKKPPC